jgi:hypothetical protein
MQKRSVYVLNFLDVIFAIGCPCLVKTACVVHVIKMSESIWAVLLLNIYRFILSRVWVTLDGVFGLNTGFIDHLCTQHGTTSNYSAMGNFHTLQFTTAHHKSFPACCVFTSLSLVMASNSEVSSASALESSLNESSVQMTLFFRLSHRTKLFYSSARPRRQHTAHSHMPTVSAEMCLQSRSLAVVVYSYLLRICCLATDIVPLSVSWPFPRNESRAVR